MECVTCAELTLSARYRFCTKCWQLWGKLKPRPSWLSELVKISRHDEYVRMRDLRRGNVSYEGHFAPERDEQDD